MRAVLFAWVAVGCVDDTICGEGTVELEGTCLPDDDPWLDLGCEPSRNGRCAGSDPEPLAYLPFAAGTEVRISQGNHGTFSHNGASAYAIDFPTPVGTVVRAARPGRVLGTYTASDTGCADPSCADLANSVVVDHGDGTFATYLHLSYDGSLVGIGDRVARGQPIALSGNTGFSTGPHLHFVVRDIFGQSQPVRFAEFLDASGGTAFGGAPVLSENEEQPLPDDLPWTTCPADLFAFLGVMLDPGVSCSEVERTEIVSGEVLVEGASALVTVVEGDRVEAFCAPGPRFAIEVPWGRIADRGASTFAVSAADPGSCTSLRPSSVGALVRVR